MGFLDFQAAGGAVADDAPRAAPEPAADARAWSDPATWGGRVPQPGEDVVVGAGRSVVVDRDIDVASITVFGTLQFAPLDLTVRSNWILVEGGGVLRAGSGEAPHGERLTLSLRGTPSDASVQGLGTKFLAAVRGGTIELNGRRRASWVPLGDSTIVGANFVRLAQPVDWLPGETVAIASGGAELPLVEERTVVGVEHDRCTLALDRPLQHRHLGRDAPVLRAPASAVAKVALLSRSIVVEGDESSTAGGFGAHCLIGSGTPEAAGEGARTSSGRFRHVEFRRMGQFNRGERFPLQWIANGDSTASCAIDCLIHQSFQRGVVVAGSPHVRLAGNVVYKPYGHAYVIEHTDDAAQMIATNLVVRPRVVRFAHPALRGLHEHRPRAFWFGPLRSGPASRGAH
ncbi:MAG: G8 domain-containing protein [Burkholderiaceae bacterium]|nr:G8 domain-containing protein [Burkholderiaceae bacterium]